MTPAPDADRLALQVEVAELKQQLAETQDQCVELAVDAGELHAQIQALQDELARVRADRDAWRAAARRQEAVA
ncbi:hypothetical protein FV241_25665 [Methylobacterium sp. WL2]|nr:hypothetical protein [Methylobacterium sp. WL2]TXN54059.1 hypothetical protein FV241_25665 [Methylobacterium sp. WL2]